MGTFRFTLNFDSCKDESDLKRRGSSTLGAIEDVIHHMGGAYHSPPLAGRCIVDFEPIDWEVYE